MEQGGAEAHQRCLILNSSAPVLSGNHGSRGRKIIQAKTVTYNEAARSSRACGEGSSGKIVSRRGTTTDCDMEIAKIGRAHV